MTKNVVNWSYKLQHELEKMSETEFAEFMKDKAIKYDNKIYGIGEENDKGKNSKVERKTSRASKGSREKSESSREA